MRSTEIRHLADAGISLARHTQAKTYTLGLGMFRLHYGGARKVSADGS